MANEIRFNYINSSNLKIKAGNDIVFVNQNFKSGGEAWWAGVQSNFAMRIMANKRYLILVMS